MALYDMSPDEAPSDAERHHTVGEISTSLCIMAGGVALLAAGAESDAGLQPDIITASALGGAALLTVGIALKGCRYLRGRLSNM